MQAHVNETRSNLRRGTINTLYVHLMSLWLRGNTNILYPRFLCGINNSNKILECGFFIRSNSKVGFCWVSIIF